jgi:hypothetical protein
VNKYTRVWSTLGKDSLKLIFQRLLKDATVHAFMNYNSQLFYLAFSLNVYLVIRLPQMLSYNNNKS